MSVLLVISYFALNVPFAYFGLRLSFGARNLPAGSGRRQMVELARWSDEISHGNGDDGGAP